MKKIFSFVALLFSAIITFTSCSQDVDVINIIGGGGYGNADNGSEVKSSNLLVNIGSPTYGDKTRTMRLSAMTRASVDENPLIHTGETVNDLEIGLNYNNNLWKVGYKGNPSGQDQTSPSIYMGSTRGYVFATSPLTSPYSNDFKFEYNINDGELTVNSVYNTSTGCSSPIPVFFYGNYPLVTSTEKKSIYREGDVWEDSVVRKNTQSTAISKNIQYGNSVLSMSVQFGVEGYLVWHSQYEHEQEGNIEWNTEEAYNEIEKKYPNVFSDYQDYLDKGGKIGNEYYHVGHGKIINIRQQDRNSQHFVGTDKWDDFNFEIDEVYFRSSEKAVYSKDNGYDAIGETRYQYLLKTPMVDGDRNYFSTLPYLNDETYVWLKCKVLSAPNQKDQKFVWMLKETVNSDKYVVVKVGTTFYVLGKIRKGSSAPTGTSYTNTYKGGIFCPDVVTKVDIVLDDLTASGVYIDDPTDHVDSNLHYNFDTTYGEMDGIWSLGQ